MKRYFLLLFIPLCMFGEEITYKPKILQLESEYPIEINAQNESRLAKNEQDIETLFQYKRFHWEYVLGVLLFGLVFLIMKQQPEVVVDKEEIRRKQRELSQKRAIDSLKILNGENLPEMKEYDLFYEKITNIVRHYIEEAYSLHAPTQTTEEFLHNITLNPVFDNKTAGALAEFLKSADTVKFSEHTPTLQECTQAQKTAENFVQIMV